MQKCLPAALRAFRIELPDGRGYWSVVNDEYATVAVADRFLFDLRFGRDRAESTTRAYAGELARFLAWCTTTGRSLEQGASDLSRFVLALRATPIERPGAGQGRPPGPARVNHVLAVVREMYKHAVGAGTVDPSVLAALYEVGDDRFLPPSYAPRAPGFATGRGPATVCAPTVPPSPRRRRRPNGRDCSRPQRRGGTGSCSSCCGSAGFA